MLNIFKRKDLNQVELDFIEFIASKRDCEKSHIEDIFIKTKKKFKFYNKEYRDLCSDIHDLFQIIYDDKEESNLFESYRFHSLIHLYRMISYSYTNSKFFTELAKYLISETGKTLKVVDYGCGLAHVSFEIGKRTKNSVFYLVDIDCLTLEFAEFRFKKHSIKCEVIPINMKQRYPKLPPHNITIANEVMEHLKNPLEAYNNIRESLAVNGLLVGYFEDHKEEMFHISPDLKKLRKKIDKDFELIKNYKDNFIHVYRKKH